MASAQRSVDWSNGLELTLHSLLIPWEDPMAEKNRKKTYLIIIVILFVVLLITYL